MKRQTLPVSLAAAALWLAAAQSHAEDAFYIPLSAFKAPPQPQQGQVTHLSPSGQALPNYAGRRGRMGGGLIEALFDSAGSSQQPVRALRAPSGRVIMAPAQAQPAAPVQYFPDASVRDPAMGYQSHMDLSLMNRSGWDNRTPVIDEHPPFAAQLTPDDGLGYLSHRQVSRNNMIGWNFKPAPLAQQPVMVQGGRVVRTLVSARVGDAALIPSIQREQSGGPRGFDPRFLPQQVPYDGPHAAGTVVIDTRHKYLYLIERNGTARRYGIGVGRPGFLWKGVKHVTRKAEWPDWRPPNEMLRRRPDLPKYMAGGENNPLGARALYLGSSLYRIHGSNEPETIGQAVSSGCFRMRNEDVIDLYNRVKVGTKVVVS